MLNLPTLSLLIIFLLINPLIALSQEDKNIVDNQENSVNNNNPSIQNPKSPIQNPLPCLDTSNPCVEQLTQAAIANSLTLQTLKGATLEAARAELERQREQEKVNLGEKVLQLLLSYEAATRQVELVESQIKTFEVSRQVFRIRYQFGEGTTEQ